MPVEILMPELGESVHEGTVSRWLKKEGEFVNEDEPVVEIMTDKVNTELPSPATGVLVKILIPEGSPVEVFKAMGLIQEADESDAEVVPSTPQSPDVEASVATPVETPAAPVETTSGDRKWYSPVVRAMAKEHGVTDAQLATIPGSGEAGRVTKKDLEAYLAAPKTPADTKPAPTQTITPAPAVTMASTDEVEITTLVGLRKVIAEAMVRSAAVPTVSTVTQVDVTNMVKFRDLNKESFQAQYGVKLTYTPFFIKAITETLLEYPLFNSHLIEGQIHRHRGVHMGVAVSLGEKGDQGLIVPVIRDCQAKSVVEIAKDLDAIAKKARSNSLALSDVQGGTFTLTNPGSYGALFGTPMINAPQSGILGTYGFQQLPVIIDGMIGIRTIMHLVLTYDHRLIDGLLAGKFLASVRDRLQKFDFYR